MQRGAPVSEIANECVRECVSEYSFQNLQVVKRELFSYLL